MKEAFANIADREKRQIIKYLQDAQKVLSKEGSEHTDIVEFLIERIQQKQLGKPLEFRYRDLGL